MEEYLKLKKSNCKNCYKCIRSCSVKSIRFSDNQANIISDDCVLCGHCFTVCPQNAKEIRNDIDQAKALIENYPVYVSLAPSFVSSFRGMTLEAMDKAFRELGFAGAEETATGAERVAREYEKLVAEGRRDIIISTCCQTVNLLVQKYYPELIHCLAPVISPMQAHCRDLKNRHPGAKTVFIGPCISKKQEVEVCSGDVDLVLTFEELSLWLEGEHKMPEPKNSATKPFKARMFPTSGGILKTMTARNPEYSYIAIDGIESCIEALGDIKSGELHNCFIEMSACRGSCINGPAKVGNKKTPLKDYITVADFSGEGEFYDSSESTEFGLEKSFCSLSQKKVAYTDSAITEVLRKIGKTKPEHELNCGSCGYNTCREKAAAVLEGKANLTMCLPFLKEKAESFSDTIIGHTPNAILVVNENYEVQMANKSACELLRIKLFDEIKGEQVVRVLDPTPFIDACRDGKNTYNKKVFLAEYRKHVEMTVIYDKKYHIIICLMRDVTEETLQALSRRELSQKTIEITDKVIEKQMRTVQEIASLLGETTAETKVALTKLKESLRDG